MADATVEFDTSIDSDGFKKGVGDVNATMDRMTATVQKAAKAVSDAFGTQSQVKIDKLSQKFEKQRVTIEKQERQLSSMREEYEKLTSGAEEPKSLVNMRAQLAASEVAMSKLSRAYEELLSKANDAERRTKYGGKVQQAAARREVEILNVKLQETATLMEQAENKTFALSKAIAGINADRGSSDEARKLASAIEDLQAKLQGNQAALQGTSAEMERLSQAAGNAAAHTLSCGRAINIAKYAAAGFFRIVGGAGRVIGAATRGIARLAANIKIFGRNTNSASGGVSRFISRLRRMVEAAFVFNIVRRALRSFTNYLGKLINSNAELSASFRQVKANLQNAFTPIWNACLPALQALANLLVTVTGYIAQFVNALSNLFGGASGAAGALNDQAAATGGAGQAAKEAKKEIAAFDKINQQAAENSGGGGGGGGNLGDIMANFGGQMSEWMTALVTEIENGEWRRVGEMIAEKINEAVARVDWAGIGRRIGQFLQNAFELAYGFLSTIDTQGLGNGIADLINNVFYTLKPETIGGTIAQFYNRLVDYMAGLYERLDFAFIGEWLARAFNQIFGEFNFSKLGTTIAQFVNGIVTALASFIKKADFGKAAANIATAINDFFRKFDMDSLAATISAFINDMVNAVRIWVEDIDWGEISAKISDAVNAFFSDISFAQLGLTIAIFVAKLFVWFRDTIARIRWKDIAKNIADGVNEFFKNVPWGEVSGAISNFVRSIFDGIREFLDRTDWRQIGEDIKTFLINIDWMGIIEAVLSVITSAFNGLRDLLAGLFGDDIANGIITVMKFIITILGVKAAFDLVTTAVSAVKAAVMLLTANPILLAIGAVAAVALLIAENWDEVKAATIAVGDSIKENVIDTLEPAITGWKVFTGEITQAQAQATAMSRELGISFEDAMKVVSQTSDGISAMGDVMVDTSKMALEGWGAFADSFSGDVNDALGMSVDMMKELGLSSSDTKESMTEDWKDAGNDFSVNVPDNVDAAGESFENLETTANEAIDGITGGRMETFEEKLDKAMNIPVDKATELYPIMAETANDAYTGIEKTFLPFKDAWDGMFTTPMLESLKVFVDLDEASETGKSSLEQTWSPIPEWFKTMVAQPISDAFTQAFADITKTSEDGAKAVKAAWNDVPEWFTTNIIDKLVAGFQAGAETIKSILNSVISGMNTMLSGVETGINSLTSAINSININVPPVRVDGRVVSAGQSISLSAGSIGNLTRIPELAKGGLIMPNKPRQVIVGDNTREPEIVSPVSTMRQAVLEALQEYGGVNGLFKGAGEETTVVMELDDREIGRVIVPLYDREKARMGVRIKPVGVLT